MIIYKPHTVREYANALKALLPPGAAWQWPLNGLGDAIFLALSKELARFATLIQPVLDNAIETHQPASASWHIDEYRRVANEAVVGKIQQLNAGYFCAGSFAGERLWSPDAAGFKSPVVLVDHLVGPLRVNSFAGDAVWSTRTRYVLRVRYFKTVVDPKLIWDALVSFKQAHVYLWFEDITGVAGEVSYAQN